MGMEWGTSKEEFNKVLLNSGFKFFPGSPDVFEHYEGEIPAGKINVACEFYQDQLCSVSALVYTYITIEEVVKALVEKFGECVNKSDEYYDKYVWDNTKTTRLEVLTPLILREDPRVCAYYYYYPIYNKKILSDIRIF